MAKNSSKKTHHLSNSKLYPRVHVYQYLDGVNIFTNQVVSVGDTAYIDDKPYELGKIQENISFPNVAISTGTLYYEFRLIPIV